MSGEIPDDGLRAAVARAIYEAMWPNSDLGWDKVDHEAWGRKADAVIAAVPALAGRPATPGGGDHA